MVTHKIGLNVILDFVNQLAGLFLDLINDELREKIWGWRFLRIEVEEFLIRISGKGKLQGPGVSLELSKHGVNRLLSSGYIVVNVQAFIFVEGLIDYELV